MASRLLLESTAAHTSQDKAVGAVLRSPSVSTLKTAAAAAGACDQNLVVSGSSNDAAP